MYLLCTRKQEETRFAEFYWLRGLKKNFEKKSQKILQIKKNVLPLQPLSPLKMVRVEIIDQGGKKPYEIKSSLKIFEQLRKFYSLLKKSNFKQYL